MTAGGLRIVVLTADTGGGHRSVSEALAEAFQETGHADVKLVDVFRYFRGPVARVPKVYQPTIKYASRAWSFGYHQTGRGRLLRFARERLIPALTNYGIRRLYREHQPELVISTHPFFQHGALRLLRRISPQTPFVTMVTDFATGHPLWFAPQTDLCLLPSEELRHAARAAGVPEEITHVTGLPVHRSFSLNRYVPRPEVRAALGIADRLTILMVGGGEGMGALDAMAIAADEAAPHLQKIIVAGRNKALRASLEARPWRGITHVYGFVRNMPQLMRASDLIVTKAGPSTLCEALVCGLPILISGFVPGQEEGNVRFIRTHDAGYFLSKPAKELGAVLDRLLAEGGAELTALANRAYALGRPDAAHEAVRQILECAQRRNLPSVPASDRLSVPPT